MEDDYEIDFGNPLYLELTDGRRCINLSGNTALQRAHLAEIWKKKPKLEAVICYNEHDPTGCGPYLSIVYDLKKPSLLETVLEYLRG
jgi:hypothetical protein